jgi:hypothetical protein
MSLYKKYRNFTGSATELAAAFIDCATAFGLDIDKDKTNERLIRYYQTEGVLDRPERYGRDSAYHFRHLIQLLNARRLVTNGLPLALAIQYNSTLSTDELEASLKAPLPNAAELLISKFKEMDPLVGSMSSRQKQSHLRAPMAVVDVLEEVKTVKKDLMHEIQALMHMKDEVNSLRYELIDRQKIDQEGYYKMQQLLEHLHMTSRKFEDLFRESIDRQRLKEEILFKENRLLLEKIFTGQEILAERITNLEKKISSI